MTAKLLARPAPRPDATPARRLAGVWALALLITGACAQAAIVRAATMPQITPAPTNPRPMAPPGAQAPAITAPRATPPPSPASTENSQPPGPQIDRQARPTTPARPAQTAVEPRKLDPALQRELTRLERVAHPKAGWGTSAAAANAAWTLGLIEMHGGAGHLSRAQAQTWFERAARFGRQPWAYAGLAWCHIEGCQGPPNPSAARQAIAQLRPHHRARALYLQWLLDSRTQPLKLQSNGPEGVSTLRLPGHELLESAAAAGDTQARIELGVEAVVNGDIRAARAFFDAAAPHSRAAAANLQLLDGQLAKAAQQPAAPTPAQALFERARRAHRGVGAPANYAEALRLYQAAASQGSAAAQRMLGLITSRPQPDGTVNLAWMAQLAWLDTSTSLPRLDTRLLSAMMYREPTPLFDLLPEPWQRWLTTVPH